MLFEKTYRKADGSLDEAALARWTDPPNAADCPQDDEEPETPKVEMRKRKRRKRDWRRRSVGRDRPTLPLKDGQTLRIWPRTLSPKP